ncbi:MAG: twin-arginine translocation signal domain-containing protein [Planctomycetes bacterium]|nr:twin-arginine translocation signal domain-containing protein [Planctomycetota bacterium]
MDISRRQFIFASAACACAVACGCASNPAPVFDAGVDHSIPLPAALSEPGTQVKVRLPNVSEPVLVVRTKIGFNGTTSICTASSRTELMYMPDDNMIKCLGCGSQFKLDGTVWRGPAKQPLKSYAVDLQGDKLKILG